MKFLFFLFIFSIPLFSQSGNETNKIDTLRYKSGKVITGELKLMKDEYIQFYNQEEGLVYEITKASIDVIKLNNGKKISFNDTKNTESAPSLYERIVSGETEEETMGNTCLLIGGAASALVILLILIGGALQ